MRPPPSYPARLRLFSSHLSNFCFLIFISCVAGPVRERRLPLVIWPRGSRLRVRLFSQLRLKPACFVDCLQTLLGSRLASRTFAVGDDFRWFCHHFRS